MNQQRAEAFSLFQIVYLLGVILFGAFVRATGSGAGCGSHWPLCNGEVVPASPQMATVIEYTHRLTSGLTLPLALIVTFLIFRISSAGHKARKAAVGTVILVVLEGLLGAGLVLFEHVAQNVSVYRAVSMGLHLINTFALMSFATYTWFFSRQLSLLPEKAGRDERRPLRIYVWGGVVALLVTGVSGAVTALGDTVFPANSPGEALRLGFSAGEHLFVRLRIYHPFIAVGMGSWLVFAARKLAYKAGRVRPLAVVLTALILAQLLLGYFNVRLMAPVWLQLTHLLMAQGIWIVFVLVIASVHYPGLAPLAGQQDRNGQGAGIIPAPLAD